MENIGKRILLIRKSSGLTQQKFAERIGTKQNTIAAYEAGKRMPMEPYIKTICQEFHIRESWLRTGEGEMHLPTTPRAGIGKALSKLNQNPDPSREALLAMLMELEPEEVDYLVRKAKRLVELYEEAQKTEENDAG